MKLHEIAEQKALKVAEMRSLLSADKLNSEGQTKFDSLKKEVTDLESQEARARFCEDAERNMMGRSTDKPLADLESKITLVDAINAQVEQRQLNGALAEYAVEHERRTDNHHRRRYRAG